MAPIDSLQTTQALSVGNAATNLVMFLGTYNCIIQLCVVKE